MRLNGYELLNIIGSGGHAKVVIDALIWSNVLDNSRGVSDVLTQQKMQQHRSTLNMNVVVYDINPKNSELMGLEVKKYVTLMDLKYGGVHVAIGNNMARQECISKLRELKFELVSIFHPEAIISPYSTVAVGTFIAARAILAPYSSVGSGVIINHGVVVDHDVKIGDCAHISPGVTLGGEVTIGRRSLIGAGANILPGVSIGDDAIVGAGAVVTTNIASGKTVVGIPAR